MKCNALLANAPRSDYTLLYSASDDLTCVAIRTAAVFALQNRGEQVTGDEILTFCSTYLPPLKEGKGKVPSVLATISRGQIRAHDAVACDIVSVFI